MPTLTMRDLRNFPHKFLGQMSIGDDHPQYARRTSPIITGGMTLLGCPLIVNENGDSCNPVLRVEGAADPNLLYIDGVTNRVGIGTDNPSVLFEVDGTARVARLGINMAAITHQLAVDGTISFDFPNSNSFAWDVLVGGTSYFRLDTQSDQWQLGRGQMLDIVHGADTAFKSHVWPRDHVTYDLGIAVTNLWRNIYTKSLFTSTLSLGYKETAVDFTMGDDHFVVVTDISTAPPRIITLPLANTLPAGTEVTIQDGSGDSTITQVGKEINCQRQGTDTIGATGSTVRKIDEIEKAISFVTNGVNIWYPR